MALFASLQHPTHRSQSRLPKKPMSSTSAPRSPRSRRLGTLRITPERVRRQARNNEPLPYAIFYTPAVETIPLSFDFSFQAPNIGAPAVDISTPPPVVEASISAVEAYVPTLQPSSSNAEYGTPSGTTTSSNSSRPSVQSRERLQELNVIVNAFADTTINLSNERYRALDRQRLNSVYVAIQDQFNGLDEPQRILQEQRRSLAMARNNSPLVPLHRAPPEILALIFEHGCEDAIREISTGLYDPTQDGMGCAGYAFRATILQVCQRWYWTALSTPRVWSLIVLSRGTTPEQLRKGITQSRAEPLHIFGDLSRSRYLSCSDMLSILRPHLDRCSFRLSSNKPQDAQSIAIELSRVPVQRKAEGLAITTRPTISFSDPVFAAVITTRPRFSNPFESVIFGNMVELSLKDLAVSNRSVWSTSQFEQLLRSCTSVETLRLENVNIDLSAMHGVWAWSPGVVLPSLQHLVLCNTTPDTIRRLSKVLSLGTLSTLVIHQIIAPQGSWGDHAGDDFVQAATYAVRDILRAAESLRHLWLDCSNIRSISNWWILGGGEQIEVLRLSSARNVERFLSPLTGPWVSPPLFSLELDNCTNDSDPPYVLKSLIQLLLRGGRKPLHSLTIDDNGAFPEEHISFFRNAVPSFTLRMV